MKIVIHGTVHRIFNETSDWQSFNVALKKNQAIWTENQYPINWFSNIVNDTLDKMATKRKITARPRRNGQHLKTFESLNKSELKLIFFVDYRGNLFKFLRAD